LDSVSELLIKNDDSQINRIKRKYTRRNKVNGNFSQINRIKKKYTRSNLLNDKFLKINRIKRNLVTAENSLAKSTIKIENVAPNEPKLAKLKITERKRPTELNETLTEEPVNNCLLKSQSGAVGESQNKFKCLNCNKLFSELKQLHIHKDISCHLINKSVPDGIPYFKCYFCMRIFSNKFKFMSHTLLCSSFNSF
jgi:hypothetical protein